MVNTVVSRINILAIIRDKSAEMATVKDRRIKCRNHNGMMDQATHKAVNRTALSTNLPPLRPFRNRRVLLRTVMYPDMAIRSRRSPT